MSRYIAIDLKSFYASVECVMRGLDPLKTNLVVADEERTDKTVCLAVSPSLKAYGIGGRARLFEVRQKVMCINNERLRNAGGRFTGESFSAQELAKDKTKALTFIIARPRMRLYLDFSLRIRDIYLKYIASEDMHVYSVDEVFIDTQAYKRLYRLQASDLAMLLIREVLSVTGITATAGVGDNMYLAKVAMDIVAKHKEPDANGVRIASLTEMEYRRTLWEHTPITDFWRIGAGTAARLSRFGLYTMGDVARQSLRNEELLYRLFGINAELLIDHAWGWEPVTMSDVKSYAPERLSLSTSQVLKEPYDIARGRVVVLEMADTIALRLFRKRLYAKALTLTIGYDRENMTRPEIATRYTGEVCRDHYQRLVPKPSRRSARFPLPTQSAGEIMRLVARAFDDVANPLLLQRRITITMDDLIAEPQALRAQALALEREGDLFRPVKEQLQEIKSHKERLQKEASLQKTRLEIGRRFGKNALLRGLNFALGSTQKERNGEIGGHRA